MPSSPASTLVWLSLAMDFLDDTLPFKAKAEARFPFEHNRLRCVRCVNENRKKRKCLRWQASNHGCHCFDRAFLLAGAFVAFLAVSVYATYATQAIAFEWKPGLMECE